MSASSATETPDGISTGAYALLLALAVFVGVVVRASLAVGDHVSSPDEASYLISGLNFWSGHGFTTLAGTPEVHFPPGLPFLLGGIHELVGGDPHSATSIATIVTSVLVILPLAGIARLVAGRRAAVLTAWIASLCPALAIVPLGSGGSAGPFTLLVITALWLALRSRSWSGLGALTAAAACGVVTGLAFLTRPEGLFYAVVLIPVLVLPALGGWRGARTAGAAGWATAARLAGAFLVAVAIVVAPYVQYLHTETGRWELTAKTEGVSIAEWRAVANDDRPAAQAMLYRLGARGFTFPEHRESLGSLVRGDPGGYLGIVGINLNQLYATMFDTSITPYPHWALLPGVLFLLAIFAAWRRRHDRVVLAVLAAIGVGVVVPIAFLIQARYLVPSAALACVLVAVGLLELPRRWFLLATVATFLLIVTSTGASFYGTSDGWFHPGHGNAENQRVGEWIGAHSQPRDLIMSATPIPGFWARRNTVPIPYASADRILGFARHYGIRYLVIDQSHASQSRPQLVNLARRNRRKTLRTVYSHRDHGNRTVVYELVPRPPRYLGKAPLLGYVGDGT
ncbi:MAG: ArnT family glycosyltransferase [Acidimicrobiia bacterium]